MDRTSSRIRSGRSNTRPRARGRARGRARFAREGSRPSRRRARRVWRGVWRRRRRRSRAGTGSRRGGRGTRGGAHGGARVHRVHRGGERGPSRLLEIGGEFGFLCAGPGGGGRIEGTVRVGRRNTGGIRRARDAPGAWPSAGATPTGLAARRAAAARTHLEGFDGELTTGRGGLGACARGCPPRRHRRGSPNRPSSRDSRGAASFLNTLRRRDDSTRARGGVRRATRRGEDTR